MNSARSYIRILAVLTLVWIGLIVVIRIAIDRDAAEKIATALFMPSGILWLFMMALLVQVWPWRRPEYQSSAGYPVLLCFLTYTLGGSGYVSEALAHALERPYLRTNPLEEPPVDLVIVLGGGGGPGANGRLQGNTSGDRLILAAQLYHRHPATKFVCTGQRIASMDASGFDPAEVSRDILIRLGVPESSVETLGGRNTSEEMKALGERFRDGKIRVGLLTSAWHLPRAMRLAERNGLYPIPLPADFRSSLAESPTVAKRIECCIPNGGAFSGTWSFAKEYLGMLIGR
ncbi:MAG: YdcF family protein [Planctomycetota bacterium]